MKFKNGDRVVVEFNDFKQNGKIVGELGHQPKLGSSDDDTMSYLVRFDNVCWIYNEVKNEKYNLNLQTQVWHQAYIKPLEQKETIKLTETYDAVVYKDKVVVSCQTIPIERVKEIVEIAKKLQ